jgi:hypothetical protein
MILVFPPSFDDLETEEITVQTAKVVHQQWWRVVNMEHIKGGNLILGFQIFLA